VLTTSLAEKMLCPLSPKLDIRQSISRVGRMSKRGVRHARAVWERKGVEMSPSRMHKLKEEFLSCT
jgi:hypothetical protein